MKLYSERDIIDLGEYYTKHISAMTLENLRSKSDIAAELAFRDAEIDRLKKENLRLRESLCESIHEV